jgi:hypothetical protein
MSRYTEIETAAHHAYEDYLYEHSQDFVNGIGIGFRRGAEWADKTMLDKVYEWLEGYSEMTGIDYEVIKESFDNHIKE